MMKMKHIIFCSLLISFLFSCKAKKSQTKIDHNIEEKGVILNDIELHRNQIRKVNRNTSYLKAYRIDNSKPVVVKKNKDGSLEVSNADLELIKNKEDELTTTTQQGLDKSISSYHATEREEKQTKSQNKTSETQRLWGIILLIIAMIFARKILKII